MAAAASQRTLGLWQAASIQPDADGLPISTSTAQRQPEPLVVGAFLACKAREWHMCAIAGGSRRSSSSEKTQVSPPVCTDGLTKSVVPPREFET